MGANLRQRLAAGFGVGAAVICFALVLILTRGALLPALALGIAGGLLAAAWGLVVASRATAPLTALTTATQAAANGDPDALLRWRHEDGDLAQLAATVAHMAQALRQEAAGATEQRDTLAALVTTMADGVVLIDADGRVRLINPSGRQLLDLAPDLLLDQPLEDVTTDHGIVSLADLALNGEAVDVTVEIGPERRLVRVRGAPRPAKQGGAVLVMHDLTELRRVEAVRHEFVANASHELLTPIGTVRALADALTHGGLDDRKAARRFLKRLRLEADRLTVLVRDMLDLAQAQSGELRLVLTETDVRDVAAIVVERLQTRAAKASVTLEAQIEAATPSAFADAARLEQVLMNLVENALKFTPEGGRVQVTVRATTEEVVTQVADTGIGIPAADLPRIFERFYKVRPTATGAGGGNGLGLAIARHLVQAMHGRIAAESALGQGSTFTVTLPRTDRASDETNEEAPDDGMQHLLEGDLPEGPASQPLVHVEERVPDGREAPAVTSKR